MVAEIIKNSPATTAIAEFTRAPRSRISQADIIAIATKVSKNKATEREACAAIGINPDSFNRWKARHKNDVRFCRFIARLQESRVSELLARIDDASIGRNMKQPDWRAAAWLAQVIDRERYGDQKVISTNVNNTFNQQNNFLFEQAVRQIYGQQPAQVTMGHVKQVSDVANKECDQGIVD